MYRFLKKKINQYFLNKTVKCKLAFNCVNYDYDICKHCKENLNSITSKNYSYESAVECSICGNRNVVKGFKCNNCGEIV